ncbi:molybdopterin molybdotransferase MoeA [Brachybacterium hainanense]|uniref:Molybdopterin molybdenumtransferase n=1 Tax=Brachybacterium hainanense TaxID=1541174 RepID=A0ABV6RE50_9MICO
MHADEHPDAWRWRARTRELLGPLLAQRSRGADAVPAGASGAEPGAVLAVLGGILREDLRSPEDVPGLPVSAMDGFAVRAADVDPAGGASLPVALDLPASPGPAATAGQLPPGAAARIMTGAPIPHGADAVIEVERTDADPHGAAPARILIGPVPGLRAGRHVRGAGEEIARDSLLAPAGTRVGPGLLALAAMLGVTDLPVHAPDPAARGAVDARAPRVTVLVTGDEVLPGGDLPFGQATGAVRDSNGIMLAAAVAERGCAARILRSGDDPAAFLRIVRDAAQDADLVLTTGGIGHGAFDVVKAALGPAGEGTSHFAHLALRPGGPQGRGTLPGPDGRAVPVVHLPGTPVGALVGFHLVVRPLLGEEDLTAAVLLGGPGSPRPPLGRPRGARDAARSRLHALPARLEQRAGEAPRARLLPGRRLAPFATADALVIVELAAGEALPYGESVRCLDLRPAHG